MNSQTLHLEQTLTALGGRVICQRCQAKSKRTNLEQTLTILGGRVICQRCQAKSKRTKLQCAAPALKGKRVCKTHGGRSTGPKSEAGRQRCAEAKTIHGRETRVARSERSLASARLAVLETVGHTLGFMNGKRTRGRKPDRMCEVFPELQHLLKQHWTSHATVDKRKTLFEGRSNDPNCFTHADVAR